MAGRRKESQVFIAGRLLTMDEALKGLLGYPRCTVKWYDLPRCPPGPITPEEIVRTRAINSRINNAEGDWLQSRSAHPDCPALDPDANLLDADPEIEGGLYDQANGLFRHFQGHPGIAMGKISKVLHLKYPSLIPILDSRVQAIYRPAARQAALESARWAPKYRRLFWVAIRNDLLASQEGLNDLRQRISHEPDRKTFARLTDLRLLDALTWALPN